MKNNIYLKELVAGAIVIITLVLFLNPVSFYMPTNFQMMALLVLVVAAVLFFSFVRNEKARDEREGLHRSFAGRYAFFAGAAVLLIGIVVQDLQKNIDPWLVIALGVMIIAKLIGSVAANKKY